MAVTSFKIDFMGKRKIAAAISSVLVILSAISLLVNQVNWGLDFTGGTLVEVTYDVPVNPVDVRAVLDAGGFQGHVVQYFGSESDVLVRIPPQKSLDDKANAKLGDGILDTLRQATKGK